MSKRMRRNGQTKSKGKIRKKKEKKEKKERKKGKEGLSFKHYLIPSFLLQSDHSGYSVKFFRVIFSTLRKNSNRCLVVED